MLPHYHGFSASWVQQRATESTDAAEALVLAASPAQGVDSPALAQLSFLRLQVIRKKVDFTTKRAYAGLKIVHSKACKSRQNRFRDKRANAGAENCTL